MDPQAKLELDRLSGNSNLEKQGTPRGLLSVQLIWRKWATTKKVYVREQGHILECGIWVNRLLEVQLTCFFGPKYLFFYVRYDQKQRNSEGGNQNAMEHALNIIKHCNSVPNIAKFAADSQLETSWDQVLRQRWRVAPSCVNDSRSGGGKLVKHLYSWLVVSNIFYFP